MLPSGISEMGRARRKPHRIFVVDPHPIMRRGYRALVQDVPDLTICGEATDMSEALARIELSGPDLVITSSRLGPSSGLDLVSRVHKLLPSARILVVSHQDASYYRDRVLEAGGDAYLERIDLMEHGVDTIHRILGVYPFNTQTE